VIQQYWVAVQARGNLEVNQKSLKLAETSNERDARALELGALPPWIFIAPDLKSQLVECR